MTKSEEGGKSAASGERKEKENGGTKKPGTACSKGGFQEHIKRERKH